MVIHYPILTWLMQAISGKSIKSHSYYVNELPVENGFFALAT